MFSASELTALFTTLLPKGRAWQQKNARELYDVIAKLGEIEEKHYKNLQAVKEAAQQPPNKTCTLAQLKIINGLRVDERASTQCNYLTLKTLKQLAEKHAGRVTTTPYKMLCAGSRVSERARDYQWLMVFRVEVDKATTQEQIEELKKQIEQLAPIWAVVEITKSN